MTNNLKTRIANISATPSKRIYLSIIADYHLDIALCELIDNAIDNWIYTGQQGGLEIIIDLDYEQQSISVKDNSGGIEEENIQLIVSPGHSRTNDTTEIIGVFGVGSKRAVVALAKNVKIRTRHNDNKTLLVEFDNEWVEEEGNWDLPVFEVDPIEESSTIIELSVLREQIEESKHQELLEHLSTTYALFLDAGGVKIVVNDQEVVSKTFENWSFPPDYLPQEKKGPINFRELGQIEVSITGGLSKSHRELNSSNDEYGVYFYCNDRLISRAYKGHEVGFKPPRLGKPHPSLSLARVIVKLTGPVMLMPWNSSKSEIDFKHKAFKEIAEHIERMLFTYASMSRNWSGEWPQKVFAHSTGDIQRETLSDISRSVRLHVPVVRRNPRPPKYIKQVQQLNKQLADTKQWTIGLYEAIIAVEEIGNLDIEQKNRISLLILDSTLEIAFKEYLLNESGSRYSDSRIRGFNRVDLQNEVKNSCSIRASAWTTIDAYYIKRCDLVHSRSTTQISDRELKSYRKIVEYALTKMFRIRFPEENG